MNLEVAILVSVIALIISVATLVYVVRQRKYISKLLDRYDKFSKYLHMLDQENARLRSRK